MQVLSKFYSDTGPERIGFVIGNKIIEVNNICETPDDGFMVSASDIIKYAEQADAFWHTHPNQSSNLSSEDYVGIKNWPNMVHYIVGKNGVSGYQYNDDLKAVVEVHDD
jgi:proteasome lid subunit RPN8/RPN11